MYPKTDADWARTLAALVDCVLLEADPEGHDSAFDLAREMLDRYSFWRAEMSGQLSMQIGRPIAAHGCHCHEEETE